MTRSSPRSSDVDLVVVFDDDDPPVKPGKLVHREASCST